eukprot:3578560-Rhodomonas_salina.1
MDESFVQQLGRGHVRATGGHADDSQQSGCSARARALCMMSSAHGQRNSDVSGLSVSTNVACGTNAGTNRSTGFGYVCTGTEWVDLYQSHVCTSTEWVDLYQSGPRADDEGGGGRRRRLCPLPPSRSDPRP